MRSSRIAGGASMLLGAGIIANALLGPLVFHIIRIRESPGMETQLLGGELTSLFLAGPIAMVAGLFWWRGGSLGPTLAIGPSAYALYTYVQFVLVPDYTRYEGNNELFFPLYLALVILAWWITLTAWERLGVGGQPRLSRWLARSAGVLLVAMSAAFALAWFASMATIWSGARPVEYLEHATAFWLVRLMDLAFVIPCGLAAGVSLLRGSAAAPRRAYGFIGVQFLLTSAVAGMAVRMWIRDDPAVTPALLVISCAGAIACALTYVAFIKRAVTASYPLHTCQP